MSLSLFFLIKFYSKLETMACWRGFAGLRGATCGRVEVEKVVDRKLAVTPLSVKTELRRGPPLLQNKKNISGMNPLSGEEPYRVTYPGFLLHTEFI